MVKKLLESVQVLDDITNETYYEIDLLSREELVSTFIEIEAIDSDTFLKVKESLTRVGIANRTKKELHQSMHILHKKGHYYLVHFLELYGMDAKPTEIFKEDYLRRNHIAKLLETWGLIKILNKDIMFAVVEDKPINVYVLPYKEKLNWTLRPKYEIGTIKEYTKSGNK